MSEARLFDESFLRRLEGLALIFRQTSLSQTQGERRSKRRGQSVEFSDFRPYTLGDDFRRIDWNAYARLERLFIKLFVEEQDITLHLLLDNSKSMDWGSPNKLDFSKQAAAALGYIALVSLDRVAVSTPGAPALGGSSEMSPLRGRQSAIRLFNFLQAITADVHQPSIPRWLGAYAERHRIPGAMILISDLMSDEWFTGINLLRKQSHELSILHIMSPDEFAPELAGDFRLIDSETQAQIELTADFETLQRYREHLLAWQEHWRKFARERGILYIPVLSSTSLEELLFAWLPKQGLLR